MKKILSLVLVGIMAFSLTACTGKSSSGKKEEVKNVPVSEILTSVQEAYGDSYYPNVDYDAETLESIFGVKADWCEEFVAQGPMMSTNVDTFVAIKAKDANVQEVEDALVAHRNYLLNDSLQYPTNLVKIQASTVESIGNYVFFILLGEIPMEVEEQGDEAILEVATEQVKIGVDAINSLLI